MVRVTHPFHPRFGQELEFVKRLLTWRADRVFFFDEAGALGSLPAEWTDLAPPDGFVVVAHGRVPFRTSCLLELADRLEFLRSKLAIKPQCSRRSFSLSRVESTEVVYDGARYGRGAVT